MNTEERIDRLEKLVVFLMSETGLHCEVDGGPPADEPACICLACEIARDVDAIIADKQAQK